MRIGALAVLWVLPLLLVTGWLAPARLARGRDRHRRGVRARGADRPLRALAARAARPGGGHARRLRRRPRARARRSSSARCWASTRARDRASTASATSSSRRSSCCCSSALAALLMRRADFESVAARFGEGPGRSRRARSDRRGRRARRRRSSSARASSARTSAASSRSAPGSRSCACCMLPGRPSRRTIVARAAGPVPRGRGARGCSTWRPAATGTSRARSSEADSPGALWDVVERRYTLAFNILETGSDAVPHGRSPLLAVAYAVRYRERIYAPLRGSPVVAGGARRRRDGLGRRLAVQRLGPDPAGLRRLRARLR